MNAELDPWDGSLSPRPALAGLAKLTVLDGAERMLAIACDEAKTPAARAQALYTLNGLSPALAQAVGDRLPRDAPALVWQVATELFGQDGEEHRDQSGEADDAHDSDESELSA